MDAPRPEPAEYDVVVCGASLAGAATALLLLRAQPRLRLAILEKSEHFPRRVGEATVEISAYFLGKVLGLTQHLNECHLAKQGMRFWFANAKTQTLADCSELGSRYLTRMPSWQVDRSILDEEVLRRAVAAGATLVRPAKALHIALQAGGTQTITFEQAGLRREIRGRWVVDASGFAALLARQEGWLRRNEAHPTTAVWARWQGVKDWDGLELADRFPEWFAACHTMRATATNHLMGDGWWSWWIPLRGGDFSIGVVFDQRRVQWPRTGGVGASLKDFLTERHPVARELLADATPVEGDVKWRAHLPYSSTRFAGDGFALAGDAAAFLDPFYSPGMDWLSYTATRITELILAERGGETGAPLAEHIAIHNRILTQSYERWFEGIYRDKYDVMGDYELMRAVFRLDLSLYYLGVVSQPIKFGPAALLQPVFATAPSEIPFRIMRLYNRRLACMARSRRERGTFGAMNAHQRLLLDGYLPDNSTGKAALLGLLGWLRLELTEGWRTWFTPTAQPKPLFTPAPAAS
jgi:flavin-dependent dehydrogenase